MAVTEDEHRRNIFEKHQAAIDAEVERIAIEQPGLDHERIKRDVRKILGAYQRREEKAAMGSYEEFWDGLRRFFSESYPGNEPRGEFEATHEVHSRVMRRMGWDQIADASGFDLSSEDDVIE